YMWPSGFDELHAIRSQNLAQRGQQIVGRVYAKGTALQANRFVPRPLRAAPLQEHGRRTRMRGAQRLDGARRLGLGSFARRPAQRDADGSARSQLVECAGALDDERRLLLPPIPWAVAARQQIRAVGAD